MRRGLLALMVGLSLVVLAGCDFGWSTMSWEPKGGAHHRFTIRYPDFMENQEKVPGADPNRLVACLTTPMKTVREVPGIVFVTWISMKPGDTLEKVATAATGPIKWQQVTVDGHPALRGKSKIPGEIIVTSVFIQPRGSRELFMVRLTPGFPESERFTQHYDEIIKSIRLRKA